MLRKISIILIVAVLMPSAVLAFLAVRSLKDQQIVLERQQGLLYQEVVDGVALRIDSYMQNLQNKFALEVDEMLAGKGGGIPPEHFNSALRLRWPLAKVGFVVDNQGVLLSPRPGRNSVEQKFLEDNRLFFANTEQLAVYNQNRVLNRVDGTYGHAVKGKGKIERKKSFYVSFEKSQNSMRFRGAIVSGNVEANQPAAPQQPTAPQSQSRREGEEQLAISRSAGQKDLFGEVTMLRDRLTTESAAGAAADAMEQRLEEVQEEAETQQEDSLRRYARPSASPLASVAMKSRPPRQTTPAPDKETEEVTKQQAAPSESTLSQMQALDSLEALTKSNLATRRVNPTQRFDDQSAILSKVQPEYAAFQSLVGDERQGAYARFLQDRLAVFFWYRPPGNDSKIFGVELSMPALRESVGNMLDQSEDRTRYQVPVALAILDDKAQPVAVVPNSFSADWRRPFVATELGERIEILPHWEVAAYLVHPQQLQEAATSLRWSLGSIIGLMLLAVALGGIVLWRDFRRELVSARQKTDFVSNVSHELKTPLTSIRMFSELLRRQNEQPQANAGDSQQRYLDIIIAEASRLTRLINNILDFSRMEQSRKQYRMAEMDLAELTREIAVAYRPHLEQSGFELEISKDDLSLPVRADRDAITQVLLNLISNAEKYGGDAKSIRIDLEKDEKAGLAMIRVMDRGAGVPRGHEGQIFKKFYRAHDSLSSGIQGSGLGLTLALSIAQSHEGQLSYTHRPGGGACFTLELPLVEPTSEKKKTK